MAHACNPSILGVHCWWNTRSQEFETILANMMKPYLYQKLKKIHWVLWQVPVIPAIREAETGELLESRLQRLQ